MELYRKKDKKGCSPSNPTFATELHLVTGLATMTTCSGHVLRLDLYLLEERWTDSLLQLNKQSTSSVQVGNICDSPKSPVVRRIVEIMQSYQTPHFVFKLCHISISPCFLLFDDGS